MKYKYVNIVSHVYDLKPRNQSFSSSNMFPHIVFLLLKFYNCL